METDRNNSNLNNSSNLKMLPKEELESKIDFLLAKCRADVDIKTTTEKGAMFKKGPFQISISLATKMQIYQEELLYCRRNPYDVLLSVCADNGWSPPEFRAVDYILGEGFLLSVVVNDHELVSKWRSKRILLAADLASANFLRYLGLWVNVRNLPLFFDWEQITTTDFNEEKHKDMGDLNGFLYFMGFNVVKTEPTDDIKDSSTSTWSLKPNKYLQFTKMMYVFFVSRGEKVCWLTDMDIEYFKQIFGDLEPNALYAFNSESWKYQLVCSCKKKRLRICFRHDQYFFYFMLKDFYYVEKFGPVDVKIFEELKKIKTEEDKPKFGLFDVKIAEGPENIKIEEEKPKFCSVDVKISEESKNIKTEEEKSKINVEDTLQNAKTFYKKRIPKLKYIEKEHLAKCYSEECLMDRKRNIHTETSQFEGMPPTMKLPEPLKFDPSEIPVNLREYRFDLKSKIFGKEKVEGTAEEEKSEFKISFNKTTGISNVKSSVGSWISVADVSPPRIPARGLLKRPSCITVVTSKRKKKK